MQRAIKLGLALTFACGASAAGAVETISILDYCDAKDPAWATVGGCSLKDGDVTLAEFRTLLNSALSSAVVGHPAWRFEPSFEEVGPKQAVRARNLGGEGHTFTEVAEFGGGIVPPLNKGLTMAPECAAATILHPGDRVTLRDLAIGEHKFQCCIHPWMRALIKVEPEDHDD